MAQLPHSAVQLFLFADLEVTGRLTEKERHLVEILEIMRIEEFLKCQGSSLVGRPSTDRVAIARAFVAKAVLNLSTTVSLLDNLRSRPALRKVCGWEPLNCLNSLPNRGQ